MVVFHVSTFILLLHIAGGSSFRTSRPQPAKAIRKEKRLKTAWLSRFPLAGAEGLGLACRLGRCFCLLVCRGLHRRPASRLPARSVLLHTLYAEVSTGDPHPSTLSECLVFISSHTKNSKHRKSGACCFGRGRRT